MCTIKKHSTLSTRVLTSCTLVFAVASDLAPSDALFMSAFVFLIWKLRRPAASSRTAFSPRSLVFSSSHCVLSSSKWSLTARRLAFSASLVLVGGVGGSIAKLSSETFTELLKSKTNNFQLEKRNKAKNSPFIKLINGIKVKFNMAFSASSTSKSPRTTFLFSLRTSQFILYCRYL